MTKWGHALVILVCAALLAGLMASMYNQHGPGTEELRQTVFWFGLLAAVGGLVVGAIIWWLPWPFIEMLWHRQPTDSAIYLMIILNTVILAAAYAFAAQQTKLVYPEIACIAAAIVIYYRNYTVEY